MTDLRAIFDSLVVESRRLLLRQDGHAFIYVGDDDGLVSPALPVPEHTHPADALRMLGMVIHRRGDGPPAWAALCADSYMMMEVGGIQAAESIRPGALEAAFLRDDPRVRECLAVSMMHGDGRLLFARQPYVRRHLRALNRDTLDFEQVTVDIDGEDDMTLRGEVPDALRAVLGL